MCFCRRNRYTIFFGLSARILSSRFQGVFVAKKTATDKQDLLHTEFYFGPQSKTRLVQRRIQPLDMIMPVPTMPSAQAEMGDAVAHTANPTAASSASAGRVASPAEKVSGPPVCQTRHGRGTCGRGTRGGGTRRGFLRRSILRRGLYPGPRRPARERGRGRSAGARRRRAVRRRSSPARTRSAGARRTRAGRRRSLPAGRRSAGARRTSAG